MKTPIKESLNLNIYGDSVGIKREEFKRARCPFVFLTKVLKTTAYPHAEV